MRLKIIFYATLLAGFGWTGKPATAAPPGQAGSDSLQNVYRTRFTVTHGGRQGLAASPDSTYHVQTGPRTSIAYGIALAGTVLPLAGGSMLAATDNGSGAAGLLLLSGAFVGPSAGQFYAGSPGAAFLGIGIRSAGVLLLAAGVSKREPRKCTGTNFNPEEYECEEGSGGGGSGLAALGLITMVGGTLYSLIDTHFAVERRKARQTSQAFLLTPTLGLARDGGFNPGAMASLRF